MGRTDFRAQQTKPSTQGSLALSSQPTNLTAIAKLRCRVVLRGGLLAFSTHPRNSGRREPWLYEAATSCSRYWRRAARTTSAFLEPVRSIKSLRSPRSESFTRTVRCLVDSPTATGLCPMCDTFAGFRDARADPNYIPVISAAVSLEGFGDDVRAGRLRSSGATS